MQGDKLGEGVYGTVYIVKSPKESKDKSSEKTVIKVYKRTRTLYFESIPEIDLLFRLKSRYLIQAIALYLPGEKADGCAVEMPFIGGKLKKLLPTLTFGNMRRLFLHYLLGLNHLHVGGRYLHLDISVNNCLYSGSMSHPYGVLIDYGFAGAIEYDEKGNAQPIKTKALKISELHRPPECFPQVEEYSVKSDIWSLGILFVEILGRGKDPLRPSKRKMTPVMGRDGKKNNDQTNRQSALKTIQLVNEGKFLQLVPVGWKGKTKRLLKSMLHKDPEARLDTVQLLKSEFFRGMEKMIQDSEVIQNPCPRREKPINDFTPLGYRGLLYLRDHLRRPDFNHFRTEFYFLVFDLYFRCLAGVICAEESAEEKICLLCASCITIGIRALYSHDDIPRGYIKKFTQHKPDFLLYDGHLLRYLGGIIRRPWLYDACSSLEQLRYLDSHFFNTQRPDLLQYYLTLNPKDFVRKMSTTGTSSKFVSIAEL